MKHANVALFVPHNGCPHACSFCNQRQITGQSVQPTAKDVEQAAETALRSLSPEETNKAEIAFFGGSFTAIDRDYMTSLLRAASPFIGKGLFRGIRISTRPDAIDSEVLSVLGQYGVTSIELGAQSMCDEVLRANRRGHTSRDVIAASGLIRQNGFSLGLQMMTGLYMSNDERDRETALSLASLEPDTVRIYPTLVLKGSELYERYISGEYRPQTLDEAVRLCSELLEIFESRGINVIRLGLHDSDSLRESTAAGPYHPALRELCQSERMFSDTLRILSASGISSGNIRVSVNPRSVSRFIGQNRRNIKRLEELGITVSLRQDEALSLRDVRCEKADGDEDSAADNKKHGKRRSGREG